MINQIKAQLKKFWRWITCLIIGGVVLAAGSQTTLLDTSKINYPLLANTNIEKIEFLYQSQEALRLQHNEMGVKFRNGEITKEEWQRYLKEDFEPKSEWIGWGTSVIGEALGEIVIKTTATSTGKIIDEKVNARQYYKKSANQSNTWAINLQDIIKK